MSGDDDDDDEALQRPVAMVVEKVPVRPAKRKKLSSAPAAVPASGSGPSPTSPADVARPSDQTVMEKVRNITLFIHSMHVIASYL